MGRENEEMLVKNSEGIKCYHCGEACKQDHLVFEEKDFCCQGCKTVYEILKDNDLCEYYTYENHPGSALKDIFQTDKFLFLDNEEIIHKLLDFSGPEINKITLFIPKIHCSSCIWLLENLRRFNPHLKNSRVNFTKKTVSIDYSPSGISLREIANMLTSIGYEPYISLDDEKKQSQKDHNRDLYIKIGVAGFCFGNIMLLSFPDYLGVDFIQDRHLKPFFSILNILLSLPIVFYSGSGFLISAYQGIKQRYVNIDVPLALGIIALFGRSVYEIMLQIGPGYLDSLAGLIFFLLTGKWFQSKTYEGLSFERDYKSYFPLASLKEKGGITEIMPVAELKKDDIIIVRNQEIVPCDGMLLSENANMDYSFVTGESRLVDILLGGRVYAGGKQKGANIRVKVIKEVSQSYLTQLWNHESFKKEKRLLSQAIINRVSKYFTIIILLIAFSAFFYWLQQDIRIAMNAFTAVLIIACPCALAMSVPYTYGNVTRVLGRNKLYLKNVEAIERLNNTHHIVFDKTGTLTESGHSGVKFDGPMEQDLLQMISGLTFNSTHPLSRRIYNHLFEIGIDGKNLVIDGFREIPGKGILGKINGKTFKIGSLEFIKSDGYLATNENGTGKAKIFVDVDGKLMGSFQTADKYREGLEETIMGLKSNYDISLLSGDNDQEREYLMSIFPHDSQLLFNQKPEDKLNFIKVLQSQGKKVLMVGDGLNDAGALQQSDIGIAVAEDASSFSPASDAILSAGEVTRLPLYLRFTRSAKTILILSFTISFLYNVIGLTFAVSGTLTPVFAAILMPISSITIVAFTTLSVNLRAKQMKL
jgi:P-type Cu+ transporter